MRLVAGILTRERTGCAYVMTQYFRHLCAIRPLEDHYISGQQIFLHLGNGEGGTLLRTYATPFHSPQSLLFPLDDAQWLKALHVLAYAPRPARREGESAQLPLFPPEVLDALPT